MVWCPGLLKKRDWLHCMAEKPSAGTESQRVENQQAFRLQCPPRVGAFTYFRILIITVIAAISVVTLLCLSLKSSLKNTAENNCC